MASFKEKIKHLTKYGIARPNRFNVVISLPTALEQLVNEKNAQNQDGGSFLKPLIGEFGVNLVKEFMGSGTEIVRGLDIMCEDAELPGKSFSTSETKYNSDYLNAPFSITYTPITIKFVVSRDFLEKNIIDEWMNMIINPETHDISYYNDFISPSIEIQQLNEQDQVTHKVQLRDAFPSEVIAMPLSNTSRDDYHTLSVTFIYRNWRNLDTQQPTGVVSLSQTPLGPITTPILSNPVVQNATEFVERQTGGNLEGTAVDIYNQIDGIVRNTTGTSTNQSVSLLNGIKAETELNDDITETQKSDLLDIIDGTIQRLG
ncbi:MAG: hypothetical protein R3230_00985 [Nitrosopumilaceae archaeon]|nr:hypothetical protein [Nitrosopumilaceae archaeon]